MPSQSKSRHVIPATMIGIGLAAFIAIAADVVYHGRLWQFDRIVAPCIYEHAQQWAVWVVAPFSGLGELPVILSIALLAGAFLYRQKQWRCLIAWAIGLTGSGVINAALKQVFAISRPQRYSQFILGHGYTFPSGHTMAVTITAGMLALLWMRLKPRRPKSRATAALLVALLGTLEAAALTYIGVHYVTDVLGGLAVSLAWLGVMRVILPPSAYHHLAFPVRSPDREESA